MKRILYKKADIFCEIAKNVDIQMDELRKQTEKSTIHSLVD